MSTRTGREDTATCDPSPYCDCGAPSTFPCMTTMWGVHNDQPQLDLVDNGFISIGWIEMGDLSALGNDKEAMKAKVAQTYLDIKPGAIPGTAGTLLTFVYRMQVGDLVVYPHRPDSTLNF